MTAEHTHFDAPDAFVMPFRDATNGWEPAQRTVVWPGYTGPIRTQQRVEIEGLTDPAVVWREGRRLQLEAIQRPTRYTCIRGATYGRHERGDRVALSWPFLDRAQATAWVRDVRGRLLVLSDPVTMEAGTDYGLSWTRRNADDSLTDVSVTVETRPGETRLVEVAGTDALPEVGDRVHFGVATMTHIEAMITDVEPARDGAVRLTMTQAAPQIDTELATMTAPEWNRLSGEALTFGDVPEVPVIGDIVVALSPFDYAASPSLTVTVPVSMPADNDVEISRIVVSHRLGTSGAYTDAVVSGDLGAAALTYDDGDSVEVFATAEAIDGTASDPTSVETVAVTASTAGRPTVLPLSGVVVASGLGVAQITVATQADTVALQLFRTPDGVTLDPNTHAIGDPVTVPPNSRVTLLDGDSTTADLIDDGSFEDPSQWVVTGNFTITGGAAQATAGAVGTVFQALTLDAGETYRLRVVVSGRTAGSVTPRLTGGTAQDGTAIDADGTHLDAITAGAGNTGIELSKTADFDGAVEEIILFRASATSAPQGAHDYYVAPIGADDIANVPTGPRSATII